MRARCVRCGATLLWLAAALGVQAEPATTPERLLPFQPAGTNRIAVDLAPDGSAHPLPLIVDTGASYSFMTPRVARRLGISVRAAKRSPYRRATRLGRDLSFVIDARRAVGVILDINIWHSEHDPSCHISETPQCAKFQPASARKPASAPCLGPKPLSSAHDLAGAVKRALKTPLTT